MLPTVGQVEPPSALRANQVGPAVCEVRRSQTAYTKLELIGSAVIEPLSLKNCAPSRMSWCGNCHVTPKSAERATSMALEEPGASVAPVNDSESAYTKPFGETVSHGSLARA